MDDAHPMFIDIEATVVPLNGFQPKFHQVLQLSEGLEELKKTEAMLGRIARRKRKKGKSAAERFLAPLMEQGQNRVPGAASSCVGMPGGI